MLSFPFLFCLIIFSLFFRFALTFGRRHCRPHVAGQNKIAKPVDDLGDQFRPALRTWWIAYIANAYPAGAVATGPALGQGRLIVFKLDD